MKKWLLKVYCWFSWFSNSEPPWVRLMMIGNTLYSAIIVICFFCILLLKPNRDVFFNLFVENILLVSYLLCVWIMPTIVSVILTHRVTDEKLIRSKEYQLNEKAMLKKWSERPAILQLLISLFLYMQPYLLTILFLMFYELFLSRWCF